MSLKHLKFLGATILVVLCFLITACTPKSSAQIVATEDGVTAEILGHFTARPSANDTKNYYDTVDGNTYRISRIVDGYVNFKESYTAHPESNDLTPEDYQEMMEKAYNYCSKTNEPEVQIMYDYFIQIWFDCASLQKAP